MHEPCDHDPAAPGAGQLGIPRCGGFDGPAFERAIADLLRACGIAPDGDHTGKTPRRVRELWERRLLGGYALDPAEGSIRSRRGLGTRSGSGQQARCYESRE